MSVNLFEIPITPVVDLDSDVVVYVPGYAKKGPLEPTLVIADTFEEIFGDTPYTFANGDTTSGPANNTMGKNAPDRGWLYAKGLLDAGLTVLYHRIPASANTPYAITGNVKLYKTAPTALIPNPDPVLLDTVTAVFRARFRGSFYTNFSVAVSPLVNGFQKISVYQKDESSQTQHIVEERPVSFDPESPYFIGREGIFDNIDILFYDSATDKETNIAEQLQLQSLYYPATGTAGTVRLQTPTESSPELTSYSMSMPAVSGYDPSSEFTVKSLLDNLASTSLDTLLDTDTYPTVTYITSGGYYQTPTLAKKMLETANQIKAIALIDFSDNASSLKSTIEAIGADTSDYIKGAAFVGADTFRIYGSTPSIMADSYGYLTKLGKNLSQAIPAWIPVANVPQGVTSAVATTRPITFATKALFIPQDNMGVAINPIVYKQNSGYTIMGNRTLAKLNGVTGPDAFLNCQLVVNSVLRSARRAASNLLIVSTSPTTAFSTFYSIVSKTCEKMLVNGDGLAAYNITKLKKTKPATIDIQIELTLVEGIETFNIYVPYQIALDA